MPSFWDRSWEACSPQRIQEYVEVQVRKPDEFIDRLHDRRAKTVCDAGCGCGVYSLKLATNGFAVSGFDISAKAAEIASALVHRSGFPAELRQGSVLAIPYPDGTFDGVICRDVLDHMGKSDCTTAIRELLRITAPGGLVLISVDHADEEYELEPHFRNDDGDYVFTQGKWEDMVFHPYTAQELAPLVPENSHCQITDTPQGIVLSIEKGCTA